MPVQILPSRGDLSGYLGSSILARSRPFTVVSVAGIGSVSHPRLPAGFGWKLHFEEVRRRSIVYLNGRRIGRSDDPYTAFSLSARGLREGRKNDLMVVVDSRQDRPLPEGWWNWGGIVRPVQLVPVGGAYLEDLGALSRVRCFDRGRRCHARLLLRGSLHQRGRRALGLRLDVHLRAPDGRLHDRSFRLPAKRRVSVSMRIPSPQLWAPDAPRLYDARFTLSDRAGVQQVARRRVGLRSVRVERGRLRLNGRVVQLRGASIHEDMPGRGAALRERDHVRILQDLKQLGANIVRAHYGLNERLLRRLDQAGIMVWNQAPIWQRDRGENLLRQPTERRRALDTVERTVMAGRGHPSVIAHSVANELSPVPDRTPGTARFLKQAQRRARRADPTLPIAVDIFATPNGAKQKAYESFDLLGINQYFGWYPWTPDLRALAPYLREMRRLYPSHGLVMTEWGAEARPELAGAPASRKGGTATRRFTPSARWMSSTARANCRVLSTGRCASSRSTPVGTAGRGRDPAVRAEHPQPQGLDHLRGRAKASLLGRARALPAHAPLRLTLDRGGA